MPAVPGVICLDQTATNMPRRSDQKNRGLAAISDPRTRLHARGRRSTNIESKLEMPVTQWRGAPCCVRLSRIRM